jgi:hypothetical protein
MTPQLAAQNIHEVIDSLRSIIPIAGQAFDALGQWNRRSAEEAMGHLQRLHRVRNDLDTLASRISQGNISQREATEMLASSESVMRRAAEAFGEIRVGGRRAPFIDGLEEAMGRLSYVHKSVREASAEAETAKPVAPPAAADKPDAPMQDGVTVMRPDAKDTGSSLVNLADGQRVEIKPAEPEPPREALTPKPENGPAPAAPAVDLDGVAAITAHNPALSRMRERCSNALASPVEVSVGLPAPTLDPAPQVQPDKPRAGIRR